MSKLFFDASYYVIWFTPAWAIGFVVYDRLSKSRLSFGQSLFTSWLAACVLGAAWFAVFQVIGLAAWVLDY